jgi:6-phosphogluconolactonase
MTAQVFSFQSKDQLSDALVQKIKEASDSAIKKHNSFTLTLSGGSLPAILALALNNSTDIDFSKWHIFYADERLVPLDHEDSNHNLAKQQIYNQLSSIATSSDKKIISDHIYPINPDVLADSLKSAQWYDQKVKQVFDKLGRKLLDVNNLLVPKFDLMLLGMGPDGHTCSLFPGHKLLHEKNSCVAFIEDSPKPPSRRITFTLPVINSSERIYFVVTGEGKKDVLKAIIEENDLQYPSTHVKAINGELCWFLDDPAASCLSKERLSSL